MLGVLVNTAAIIVGSLVGIMLKKGLPERVSKSLTTAIALAVMYIGIDGMMNGENTLVLVLSMVIGAVIGTLLDLDSRLEALGKKIESRFKGNENNRIAEGFVSATLLFCVGAMAIVGALQSGLTGNHETQYTKAILDLISAAILASTLGWGVMLAAVSVFALQGSVVVLAQLVEPYLNDYVIGEMTCAGSVLILALALNMLGITKIKLMNLLPAMFVPIVLCIIVK
ncbi:MAG: DUF554 domain-containing protein [Oscillospiraceae bacterium]|nr:DUF554 domain-containing protein [Oscillospiraceae bacterium]